MIWRTCVLALTLGFVSDSLLRAQVEGGGTPELALVGVIVAENPAESVALIRRSAGGRARAMRVGQQVEGYVLIDVSKSSARLESRGGELMLFLPDARSAPRAATAGGHEPEDVWVRRSFSREIARDRIEKEIPVILSETDLSPRVEEGEVRGLGVVRLPDGTLLSETGLLPGDVLVSINGEPLRSVDSLWELLSKFVAEGEIRVVVRRQGELLKLAYAFTN